MMQLNTEITLNIENFSNFIHSPKFIQFLTSETTDIATVAFILQTLFDAEEKIKGEK